MKNLAYQLQIAFLIWLAFIAAVTILPKATLPKLTSSSVLSSTTSSAPSIPPTPAQITNPSLHLSATSFTSLDIQSGKFLLTQNDDSLHAPASITKLMLAWAARSHCQDNQVVTVNESFNTGTVLGLKVGQQFKFQDLLYAMLLPSNNDVAVAIADGCFGSQSAAVSAMNAQAQRWGLSSTHFVNTNGLDDPGNYSTARDLARLALKVMTDPLLSKIVDTSTYSVTSIDGQSYRLKSSNELLGKYGVTGIKTGTTDFAGENFVARASVSGHTIITVVLGSSDRFTDTAKLLQEIKRVYRWPSPSNSPSSQS